MVGGYELSFLPDKNNVYSYCTPIFFTFDAANQKGRSGF
jgi:hypothetical protein